VFNNAIKTTAEVSFIVLSRKDIFILLIGIALAVPVYEALIFGLPTDKALLFRMIVSFPVAFVGYCFFFAFGGGLRLFLQKSRGSNKYTMVYVLHLICISGLFVLFLKGLLLPQWHNYYGLSNAQLSGAAAYYGVANSHYGDSFFRIFPRDSSAFKNVNKKKFVTSIRTLLICVGLFIAHCLYQNGQLKNQLYNRSIDVLLNNTEVSKIIGQRYSPSYFVEGEIEGQSATMRYNLKGDKNTAIAILEGKNTNDQWEIVSFKLWFNGGDEFIIVDSGITAKF
jgi:hypothetical protein